MHLNDRMRRWLPWLLLALAVVATAAVYWPGVTGGWVFDDFPNIVDNAAIHITPGHSTLAAWVNSALSSPASFLHRPLASLTFSLNWYFGGGDPLPFKITNIAIHLVNGVLLYCMLRALLRLLALRRTDASDGIGIDDTAATRLALIVAAAWMLLPINLMAVLYVVQRMESLCQVFVLAGLWAYLHGRWMMLTATDARRDRRGFALAVGGIVLGTCIGLAAKETAVLLPVFAFLAEWIVLRFAHGRDVATEATRAGSAWTREIDRRMLWMYVFTLFVPAVLGFAWALRGATAQGAFGSRSFTLLQRLMTEPRVLVDYLHWTLLPNPMVLSLYHDEIVNSTGLLTPWTTLASIVLLAALIALAIGLRKRRPLVSLGIGWFFAAQLLTATIIPLELVYEQRMYFASIGVLLAVGVLLLGRRREIALPLPRIFLIVVALFWFGTATGMRAWEWRNPVYLATAEADRHPESARANYTAGREWMIVAGYRQGRPMDLAWKYLQRAAAIPDASTLPEQAMIMFVDHRKQGDDAALWTAMSRKLRDQPTRQEDISALISLTNCYGAGICVFDLDKLQAAYAAVLSRHAFSSRLNGAYAAFQRDLLHDTPAAIEYLVKAVAGAPGEPAYRIDLAALYAREGETEKSLQQIDALRRMNVAGRLDQQIATLERLAENSPGGAPR